MDPPIACAMTSYALKLKYLPGPNPLIDDPRPEVLDKDVDAGHQVGEDLLSLFALHVEGDAAFVAVQHREVQAVGARDVAKLPAGDVAPCGRLQLDDVRAEPGEQLRRRRTRLHMRHVEDADAVQCFRDFTHDHNSLRRRPSQHCIPYEVDNSVAHVTTSCPAIDKFLM
jgi:hypothetical protein